MQVEEQKLTLKVQTYPLKQSSSEASSSKPHLYLVEVECFFFGVQGLYEFALLNTSDGRIQPLSFEGAKPLKGSLRGEERRSPVALNMGRSEVCGVPQFNTTDRSLSVLCKADPEGGCGAHALFELDLSKHQERSPRFIVKQARFRSCAESLNPDVERWSEITL
jgi:hypothetical protein